MAYDEDKYSGTDCCADPAPKKSPGYYGSSTTEGRVQTQNSCGQLKGTSDSDVIDQLFTYHPANPSTGPKFEAVREAAKYFAKIIFTNTPIGADRTAAIRILREAVFTANAGISLGGLSL